MKLIQNLRRKNARECRCKDFEFAIVRGRCAWALGRLGPAAKPALPALIRALGDGWTQEQAREALVNLGPLALPVLIKTIKHRKWSVRWEALKVLVRLGPKAREALPAIREAQRANETYPIVVREATRAIRAIRK